MTNMPPEDLKIALQLCESDDEFKELWDKHQALKETLRRLQEKSRLTSEEEAEVKKLKLQKLVGKDKIALKIANYKLAVSAPV